MIRLLIMLMCLLFILLGVTLKMRTMILFSLVWFFECLINYISKPQVFDPSDFSLICIGLFILFTNIGMIVCKKTRLKIDSKHSTYTLNTKLFYLINIVAIAYFFYAFTIPSIRITKQYGIFYTRYYTYVASDEFFGSTAKLVFAQQFIFALFFASMAIGIMEFMNSKSSKIYKNPPLIIGVLEMLLFTYTFKGRTPLFLVLFYLLFSFIYCNKWKGKEVLSFADLSRKSKIRLISVAIIISLVSVSLARFDGLAKIKKYFVMYFGSQLTYFSELIKMYDTKYEFGRYIFCGFTDYLKLFLNRILGTGFTLGSSEIGTMIDGYTAIGPDLHMNAGCTAAFYFYYEAGVFGVIVYSLLSGMIFSIISNTVKQRDNVLWDIAYISILYVIFYSYSGWMLKYLYFWLLPLVIRLLYKKDTQTALQVQ